MAKPTLLSKDEPIVQAFRASMRGCASTVTAVSTAEGAHRFCMVATAMMSVSIDPPSVVVAINKTASIHDPLVRRGFFCVNVIGSEQEHLARELSIRAGEDRLEVGVSHERAILPNVPDGTPGRVRNALSLYWHGRRCHHQQRE
jgi:flavin reductase (DIM6/NTAB) family NADH-FMN oxidoreductase RutF